MKGALHIPTHSIASQLFKARIMPTLTTSKGMQPTDTPAPSTISVLTQVDRLLESLRTLTDHIPSVSDVPSLNYMTKDDATASTVSDESSISSSFRRSSVTFADPLVSQVNERPKTDPSDKPELFYSQLEYLNFRREFARSKRRCLSQEEPPAHLQMSTSVAL